jgi:16S rRNA (cytosine1402-N4)-methyltransferase
LTEFSHEPVLLEECIAALNINPNGVYADGTAGGGGHSKEIAKRLSTKGRLVCVDRDPEAIETLRSRLGQNPCVTIIHDNYLNVDRILSGSGNSAVNGVLLDLGVSSHQLGSGERGFSYHTEAPLDMRMSKSGETAADLVNTLSEEKLVKILFDYGEEKFARRIVSKIMAERQASSITTTLRFAEIVKAAYPAAKRRDGHPARQTFQALRIAVNHELDDLKNALNNWFEHLETGGRLCVISFHSLEDRIVKQTFAQLSKGCVCPPQFPVCVCGKKPLGKPIGKYFKPTEQEIEKNPRARSAGLRVIEKLKVES